MEAKIIGIRLIKPEDRLFKPKRGEDKAELTILRCSLDGECPFLKQGKCIRASVLWPRCVYGTLSFERTHTKRSRAYRSEVREFEERVKAGPGYPEAAYNSEGIQLIGDYYYLPYSHAAMCKEVEFREQANMLSGGLKFVPKDKFGPEQVVSLARMEPRAWVTHDKLKEWQEQEVPVFLFHLKQRFPDLYREALALDPTIGTKTYCPTVDIKPLRCKLSHIPVGTSKGFQVDGAGRDKWANVAEYTQDRLVLEDDFHNILFGVNIKAQKGTRARLEFVPDPDRITVLVSDPELIGRIVHEHPSLATLKN